MENMKQRYEAIKSRDASQSVLDVRNLTYDSRNQKSRCVTQKHAEPYNISIIDNMVN